MNSFYTDKHLAPIAALFELIFGFRGSAALPPHPKTQKIASAESGK